jgi:hypothetical protein
MLRETLIAIHYPVYQTVVALAGIILSIRLLFEYSWGQSAVCGASLVASFWVGQGIVTLIRRGTRRSSSLD